MSVFRERDPDLVMGEAAASTQRSTGLPSSSNPSIFASLNTAQSQLPHSTFSQSAPSRVPPRTGFDWNAGRSITTPSTIVSPFRPPTQDQPESEEPVHVGISCGFCGKSGLRGTRYKCVQCPNHDRCSACMTSPNAWAAHDPAHQFFPIRTKDDLSHFAQIAARLALTQFLSRPVRVHDGITCDGCAKPIQGVRHKCLVCHDYDFCGVCISDPSKRQGHNAIHAFFAIVTTQDEALYSNARAQAWPQSVRHESVVCDSCKQTPLVGVRHRCRDCRDYDLCTECISKPESRAKHDLTHAFFPIPTPDNLNLMSYNRAFELRRTSSGFATDESQKPVQLTAKISELVSGGNNLIQGV